MLYLNDIVDTDELEQMLAEGYVRRTSDGNAAVYNYTEKTQYEHRWNKTTMLCRGLIIKEEDKRVLARSMEKFFNYNEEHIPHAKMTGRVNVTDKLDGSLGISYILDGVQKWATRGSTRSDQAQRANELWQAKYNGMLLRDDWTFLAEIIYPENRIVVDYGQTEDLILIGAVERDSGKTIELTDAKQWWPGRIVEQYDYTSLTQALQAPDRPGREGLVVHWVETGARVKIKQADYIALHKIVTGLNERTIWEHLADNGDIASLLEVLPDELHAWTKDVAAKLTRAHNNLVANIKSELADALNKTGEDDKTDPAWRKTFAGHVTATSNPGLVFALYDKGNIDAKAWTLLRPTGDDKGRWTSTN